MKKLIGIILALCMLCTVASAAQVTGSANPAEDGSMKIIVEYGSIPAGAQATMLAYEVTAEMIEDAKADAEAAGKANPETALPDFVDNSTTPIVGIDQEAVDSQFEVKLADDFLAEIAAGSSRVIVVKVGGTDMDPMAWSVTFTKPAEGGGEEPGTGGGEGGEDPENPGEGGGTTPEEITVIVSYGDVNGDGAVSAADASLILQKAGSVIELFTHSKNGSTIPNTVGDVNGDGAVSAADASLILQKAGSVIDGFVHSKTSEALVEYTYTYVPTTSAE